MERDKRARGADRGNASRSSGCNDCHAPERYGYARAAQRQEQRGRRSRPAAPAIIELRNLKRKPYRFGSITTRQHTPAYTKIHNAAGGTVLLRISSAPCCPGRIVPPLSGHFRQDTISSTSSGNTNISGITAIAGAIGVSKIRHTPVSTLATTLTVWIDFIRSSPASSDASQSCNAKKRARAHPPPRRPCPGSPHPPNKREARHWRRLIEYKNKPPKTCEKPPEACEKRPGRPYRQAAAHPAPLEPPSQGRRLTHESSQPE